MSSEIHPSAQPTHAGTAAHGHTQSDPPDSAVRAQLDRILVSAVFSRSDHLRRFLSFIVEQTLAGQGSTLKESVLAHELYGRAADFDGGADPVVRVDARRLRDKLREYYQDSPDPVVISLPKGSYVPVFGSSGSPVESVRPTAVTQPHEWRPVAHLTPGRIFVSGVALVAVAVAVATAWRGRQMQPDAPVQLLPLASYPGAEGPPALSPDGTLVAFAWSGRAEPGPTDIYVKAVGSEALRRLTETPTAWENSPAWSPDGQNIAFVRDGQRVITVSHLGGAEREVSASGTHVVWAGDSNSVLIRDRDRNAGPFGIHQVFLDTLERRPLTQPHVGPGDWRFEVSPDGSTLAFIRYVRVGIGDLYVVPMRGGEPTRLSNWSANLTGLSWTPDGRQIVYSVQEPAAARLWRIDASNGRTGRGSAIAAIPTAAVNPSISRPAPGHRARLAFQTLTRDIDIYLMDLEARLVNDTIEATPFSNSTRIEASSSFSPDGSHIAFVSDRSGAPQIWIAGRDGSGLRPITSFGTSQLFVGGWSPDGARFTFDAVVDGNDDVYVVGADGGHLRRLTSEPSVDGMASWSADGRWIYFSSTRGGGIPDTWRVSPEGGPARRMTQNGGFEPMESSNGQDLFYLDRHPAGVRIDGTARLMRAPVAGGQEEVVLERVRPFLWSLTENAIVFVTSEPTFDAIDVYRFSERQVTRMGRLEFRTPYMTASRDGRWALATQRVRSDSDLMWLDNFR